MKTHDIMCTASLIAGMSESRSARTSICSMLYSSMHWRMRPSPPVLCLLTAGCDPLEPELTPESLTAYRFLRCSASSPVKRSDPTTDAAVSKLHSAGAKSSRYASGILNVRVSELDSDAPRAI